MVVWHCFVHHQKHCRIQFRFSFLRRAKDLCPCWILYPDAMTWMHFAIPWKLLWEKLPAVSMPWRWVWVFLFQYCELDNEESHTILKNLDESPKVTRYPESERVTSKLVRILMNSQESQKNQLLKCHSLENFSIRCCFISSSSNWQSCNSIFNRLYL